VATLYVALLRGINVGGKNLVKMADLKACFERAGHDEVATYIQSGNVVFRSGRAEARPEAVERLLSKTFGREIRVVVRSHAQLRNIVTKAPAGFGKQTHLSDVIFLRPPLTPARAMREVSVKEGVDAAATGPGVLYFSRRANRAAQSRLSRIAALPMYQDLTIRSWSTTTKLLALMDQR
jgi:uncharacterized protein (DUF1697 family)